MKKKIVAFLIIFFFLAFFPQSVLAAKFSLSPTGQEVTVGQEFQVNINLNTEGKEINGVQTKILFNQALLEIIGVNSSGIFPTDFQLVNNGEIRFGSGEDLRSDSFAGSSTWVSLTLKAKTAGLAELRFSCPDSAILELETANNLLDCSSLNPATYLLVEEGGAPSLLTEKTEEPAVCSDFSPETPTNLSAVIGPEGGQVVLTWERVADASYYGFVFGSGSGNYQYGDPNIGNTNQYTVRQLNPGELYYFTVFAVKGCAASGFSDEASARAGVFAPGEVVPLETIESIYQPIEEIFSGAAFPSPSPASLTPGIELEKELSKLGRREILIFGLPLLILLILLISLGIFLRRRRLSSKMPSSPETTNQSSLPEEPSSPPMQS